MKKHLCLIMVIIFCINAKAQLRINYLIGINNKTNSNELVGMAYYISDPNRPLAILETKTYTQLQLGYELSLKRNKYLAVGINYAQNKVVNIHAASINNGYKPINDIGAYIGFGFKLKIRSRIDFFMEQGISLQEALIRENTVYSAKVTYNFDSINTITNDYSISQNSNSRRTSVTQLGFDYTINKNLFLTLGFSFMADLDKVNSQSIRLSSSTNNSPPTVIITHSNAFREFVWAPSLGFKYFFSKKKRTRLK